MTDHTKGLVVDADLHGHENIAELAEFCEIPWSVALRHMGDSPDRNIAISPRPTFTAPFPGGLARAKQTPSALQMLSEMDTLGIDIGILFPDHLLSIPVIERPDFATAVAAAYNDWLLSKWLSASSRVRGAIVVAPQEPREAAAEIRREAANSEFVAICLATCGVRPLYGHKSYDPVYEAACDTGLPVVLHGLTTVHPTFPFQLDVFQSEFMKHAFAHSLSIMANVGSIIETGVPERFPELRIGLLEAGVTWIAFAMKRFDREYLERRRQVPHLKRLPSAYLADMYVGTQPLDLDRPGALDGLTAVCGHELRLIFASDWPHHDFDHPDVIRRLAGSAASRQRILYENAYGLFRALPKGVLMPSRADSRAI